MPTLMGAFIQYLCGNTWLVPSLSCAAGVHSPFESRHASNDGFVRLPAFDTVLHIAPPAPDAAISTNPMFNACRRDKRPADRPQGAP